MTGVRAGGEARFCLNENLYLTPYMTPFIVVFEKEIVESEESNDEND